MHKFLIRDTDGKKSLTATAFLIGFIVVNVKLIFSGMSFGEFNFSQFSGSDYGLSIGGLGAIYVLRRNKQEATAEQ